MTPQQKEQVQDSFRQLVPDFDRAAAMFYNRLFELNPDLRRLFKRDMERQGRILMQMLASTMASLDWMDDLSPTLEALGRRHATVGVQEGDYETFGEALLWMLQQMLGESFTPDLRTAWAEVYCALSAVMKNA